MFPDKINLCGFTPAGFPSLLNYIERNGGDLFRLQSLLPCFWNSGQAGEKPRRYKPFVSIVNLILAKYIIKLPKLNEGEFMFTTIDKFGRVIIPKRFREDLGISIGTTLNISENGKQIVIEPVLDDNPVVDRDGILVFTGKLNSKRNNLVHKDREQRMHKLLTNND